MALTKLGGGALLAALAVLSGAGALAADAAFGVGAEYSTGNYGGTEKTDILYVPFVGKYETGAWAFKLVVPYIRITGPGNVVGAGEDRVELPGGSTGRSTNSGLGDIVGSVFYSVLSERTSGLGLDVGTKVKFGSADEAKGLGTGKNDFSLQADFFKPLGAFTALGSLGYRWYGDPAGVNLDDTYYGAVGGSYRMSAPMTLGIAYDFRPRIIANGHRVSEATAFLSYRPTPAWKTQFYAVKGFSDGSPDTGVGLVLDYRF